MTAPVDAESLRVAALYEEHRAAVYAYLVRLSGNSGLAEELTQDTFLRVFRARDRLRDIENERAWIFRIATNTCFAALRRQRRFGWLPWESAGHREGSGASDIAQDVGRRDAVERALSRLPEQYRAPLLLFSHHGFSVAEVAGVLELSEGAVRTRVYRAKELFQRAYEQENRP